jgi:hypothetical protein
MAARCSAAGDASRRANAAPGTDVPRDICAAMVCAPRRNWRRAANATTNATAAPTTVAPARLLTAPVNTCAATCRGDTCATTEDCCRELTCSAGRCGGCNDFGAPCASDAECCFSGCTAHVGQNQCLSYAGGPCQKDTDCWSCWLNEDCQVTVDRLTVDVCQDGVCGCPYACCSDVECPPEQSCDVDLNGPRGHCVPSHRHVNDRRGDKAAARTADLPQEPITDESEEPWITIAPTM